MNAEATLGSRLKAIQGEAVEAQRKRTLEEEAGRNEEALLLMLTVRNFFDTAFRLFEFRLLHNKAPGMVYLGYKANRDAASMLETFNWQVPPGKTFREGRGIWTDTHKCYSLWKEFEERCNAQGLRPVWTYCYDGGGVESWYELRVSPIS